MALLRRAQTAALVARSGGWVERPTRLSRRSLLTLLLLTLAARAHSQEQTFLRSSGVLVTERGRFPLQLEIARTPAQRALGLMFRRSLAPDAGMLFDFGQSGPVAMWMKDTYVPLDMLFLDKGLRVVWIHERAEPLSLATIRPPLPVAYVLELLAGSVGRYGVRIGSILELEAKP
jgi:uncharacterized membrane protein (UPF0127 family)